MSIETLGVPEENLLEVIWVVRAGLESGLKLSSNTYMNLAVWCDEMEKYLSSEEYLDSC